MSLSMAMHKAVVRFRSCPRNSSIRRREQPSEKRTHKWQKKADKTNAVEKQMNSKRKY